MFDEGEEWKGSSELTESQDCNQIKRRSELYSDRPLRKHGSVASRCAISIVDETTQII